MAHTPHTWVTGETIAAAPLNLLEQDLAAAATAAGMAAADAAVQAAAIQRANHTGTQSADTITDGTTNKAFLATERTKLAGIAAGATVNRTDTATDAAINTAVTNLVNAAPGTLDTLGEIAAQLAADESAATALTTTVNGKAALLTTAATRTASATITADSVNPGDATANAITFTLPTPTKAGQRIVVEKIDATGNTVTVSGTIRGSAGTVALVWQFETLELIAESLTSWRPIAGHKTKTALDAAYFNVLGTASNPVTNAAAARPTGLTKVFWQCPIQPTNWVAGDEWINNS